MRAARVSVGPLGRSDNVLSVYDYEKSFAERSLLRDLEAAGFPLTSVWEWVNTPITPSEAVPILVDHLNRTNDEKLVEGIARALTDKRFASVVPDLVTKFPTVENAHIRWAIANAIAVIGFGRQTDQVIRLAGDPTFGFSRGPLVDKLHRIKDPRVEPILIAALEDPSVAPRAASALAYCGTSAAVPHLERVLGATSDKQMLKYATRAIEKIALRSARPN